MYKRIGFILGAGLISFLVSFCGSSSDPVGPDDDNDPVTTYNFSATVSPVEAGSIEPEEGTYEEGEEVIVEATAENLAWDFVNWTGDIEAGENPLTFTIDSDTDITANFNAVGSIYQMGLVLSDSLNSMNLAIGQIEGATEEFDSGKDHETPPPPPDSTALYGFFKTGKLQLLKDYRSIVTNGLNWNLQTQVGSGDSLNLSWNLDETVINGTLILKNEDSSKEVDMLTASSAGFIASKADSLVIEYILSDAK